MHERERDDILDALAARRSELKWHYRQCREKAEEVVTSACELDPVTYDVFAAGQGALEVAMKDSVIDWRQHAAVSRLYTALFAHVVDEYSESRVGFDAQTWHPFGDDGAAYEIDAYLELAGQVGHDLAARASGVRGAYEAALRIYGAASSPYPVMTTATLQLGVSREAIDRRAAEVLRRYFSFFEGILEEEAFNLADVAIELGNALGVDVSKWEQGP